MKLLSYKLLSVYWIITLPPLALTLVVVFGGNTLLLLSVLTPLTVLFTYYLFKKRVLSPVHKLLAAGEALSCGDVSNKIEGGGSDELGQIASAINQTISNQSKLYDFALQMGDGKYDASYEILSEKDQLGLALTHMRDRLQKVSKEEKARSWANEGLAKFSEILRANDTGLHQLADEFIRQLIRYLNANQGVVFVLEEEEEPVLNMVGCYAWGRKKFTEKKLKVGEGLAGQAALEKDTIYMTEIPADYVQITSGLGGANPRCVLIVPLIINEELQGVIELASFQQMEAHEIAFVQKVAENFAATLSAARTNARTQRLLDESMKMTENLRSQEEELRQNSEELQATQESLQEKLKEAKEEMQAQIRVIENERKKNMAVLEGCVDGIIVFNKEGLIEFVNKAAEEIWGFQKEQVFHKEIQQFIPIQIEERKTGFTASYVNGHKKEIDVRTEITAHNFQGEEMSVLLTLTTAVVENEPTFTIFTQKISVELF